MPSSRHLAAIMFTDIVGYTALMGQNEQKAFRLLSLNRQLQKPRIKQFNGRWLKEIGDGVMACFTTVSEAVLAAIKIQEDCRDSGEFQLRIGIHQGEVVEENDDVFGDTVNIASRIQSFARPGTIYISETVQQNIANKTEISTRYIGEERLKNVREPVRIFEIITGPVTPVLTGTEKINNATRNSIAVLPFTNMSSDPEQDYFSDGITEEIITDLSHLHEMLVISRSSVMTFKNSSKKIKEIARELNVNYILEGSIRKAGNNLRITAQLIDADTDAHVWAKKYSGTLDDIFDIQEKVSRAIVESLKVQLTRREEDLISERPISDVHAYDSYLRARNELLKWNEDAVNRAKKYIENAIPILGPNAVLLGAMGYVYWSYANLGIDSVINYQKAEDYARQAFALDPDSPSGHLILGNLNMSALGNPLQAIRHFRIILRNNPNDYDALLWSSLALILIGRPEEARLSSERLILMDPLNPVTYGWSAALQFYTGNFDAALAPCLQAFKMEPENPFWQLFVPLVYAYKGDFTNAITFIDNDLSAPAAGMLEQTARMIKPALLRDHAELRAWIDKNRFNFQKDFQYSHFIAAFCAFAGMKEDALYWLENATNRGFFNYPFLSEHETAFAELKEDVRYERLLTHVKQVWETLQI